MFSRRIPVVRQLALCRAASTLHNVALIEKIQNLIQAEERQFHVPVNRKRSLAQGLDFIRKLPYELTSIEIAEELPVGPAFIKILAEYLPSIADEVPAISEKQEKELLQSLLSIHGLSRPRASQLILAGCRHLTDLSRPKYFNMLPKTVQYNARFASHLEKPVTRQQTETVADFIRDTFPKYDVIPVGSYRRGAPTSTCARMVIIHRDMVHVSQPPSPPTGYLQPLRSELLRAPAQLRTAHLHNTVMPLLTERGLAFAPRQPRWYSWIGIFRVPGRGEGGVGWETKRERLECLKRGEGEYVLGRIFMFSSKSRGAAILYHTGSKSFLRLVEHKAEQLGLYLDQTGLWKWHPDPSEDIVGASVGPESDIEEDEDDEGKSSQENKKGKKKIIRKKEEEAKLKALEKGKRAEGLWELLPSEDEEMIFERLGLEYVAPEKRGIPEL